jgi:hypothetical protein
MLMCRKSFFTRSAIDQNPTIRLTALVHGRIMGAAPERLTAMARRISEKVRRFAMGLFNKKEELPGSALRFLSAAFPANDDKKPSLTKPGHLPVLDKAGAKAILKDIDWDAPEAKDFLAAASIDAADLPSFKIGDRPDILVGAFKDPIRIELFERLLCCSCCCGSCRICKWYPFCRRRCGRVLFELKDGSTYWAYRVRVIGGDVEKDTAHPGGVKITVAAAGVHNHDDRYSLLTHTHMEYAPAAHTNETNPHSTVFATKAPRVWDGTTPVSSAPVGYAPASHLDDDDPHSTVLAAKAPRVWDGATPAGSAPEGYAPASHLDDDDPHSGKFAASPHGNSVHSVPIISGYISKLALNPPTTPSGMPATYWIKIYYALPTGGTIPSPLPGTSMNDWINAQFVTQSGGIGTTLIVEDAAIHDGTLDTPPATSYISCKLYYMPSGVRMDYNSSNSAVWGDKIVTVMFSMPVVL